MPNGFDIKAAWDVVRCVAWVCRLARISIGGTLAGFAILLLPDQSRDIILAAGEGWGWGWGSELRAPPSALLQTRSARGLQEVALTQSVIAQEFGGAFVHFALSKGCGDRAPLGWVLSNYARESLNQAWSRPTCAQQRVAALIAAMQPVTPLAAAE